MQRALSSGWVIPCEEIIQPNGRMIGKVPYRPRSNRDSEKRSTDWRVKRLKDLPFARWSVRDRGDQRDRDSPTLHRSCPSLSMFLIVEHEAVITCLQFGIAVEVREGHQVAHGFDGVTTNRLCLRNDADDID